MTTVYEVREYWDSSNTIEGKAVTKFNHDLNNSVEAGWTLYSWQMTVKEGDVWIVAVFEGTNHSDPL